MAKTYDKVCPVCGKAYQTTSYSRIYCGLKCEEEARRRRGFEQRKAAAEARKGQGWRQPRTCRICGKVFAPRSPINRVCPSPECRRLDNRIRMHARQDELTRQREAVEALERGERGIARNLEWRSGAVCPICGEKFIPKNSTNRICPKPECRREAARQNAEKGNRRKREARDRERAEKLREAQACIVQPGKGAELTLREAIRMPNQAKPGRGRRKRPRPGSIEWCVAEAEMRGMSYGQFVAAMDGGMIEIDAWKGRKKR